MKKILSISFLIFLLDMISKHLMLRLLQIGDSIDVIPNFFSLTLAKNTGIAFSMFQGKIYEVILITIFVIFLLVDMIRHQLSSKIEKIGYAFVIGGALGNLTDRIFYGFVIDFLDFNFWGWDYPIFNLADCFIVIGVILLFISNFKERGHYHASDS